METQNSPLPKNKLLEYARLEYANGTPPEKIKNHLISAGWSESQVVEAMKGLGKSPSPEKTEHSKSPRHSILHTIKVAVITAVICFLIAAYIVGGY